MARITMFLVLAVALAVAVWMACRSDDDTDL